MNGTARALPPAISEAAFQARIMDAARRLGWLVHHSPRSTVRGRTMTAVVGYPGLPDLILARHGVLILAELKVGRNKPSPQQLEWLAMLGPFGRLWRPEDWDTEILPTLRGQR